MSIHHSHPHGSGRPAFGVALAITAGYAVIELHVLMEGVPPAIELDEIGRGLAGLPGVVSVHDLHVWSIVPGKVALSAHIELAEMQQWPALLAAAGTLLHDRYGIGHITLQPEIRDAPGRRQTSVIRLWPRHSSGTTEFRSCCVSVNGGDLCRA